MRITKQEQTTRLKALTYSLENAMDEAIEVRKMIEEIKNADIITEGDPTEENNCGAKELLTEERDVV